MANSKPKESHVSDDFVLKHRIAGAAFLLFFGAVVLPLLLGPPSEASKTPRAVDISSDGDVISSTDIENELLGESITRNDGESEQVYISKITPLDADRLNETAAGKDDTTPESKATTDAKGGQKADAPAKENKTANSDAVAQKESSKTDSSKTVKAEAKKTSNKPSKDTKGAEQKPNREAELAAALDAESKQAPNSKTATAKIDVGWVVQVGVFTDKKGAEKVVKDLASKGFAPSTSIVDTNRGKATGTRVWLGPFAQRVEAAKTKTLLTERTGEPGFIRAYP